MKAKTWGIASLVVAVLSVSACTGANQLQEFKETEPQAATAPIDTPTSVTQAPEPEPAAGGAATKESLLATHRTIWDGMLASYTNFDDKSWWPHVDKSVRMGIMMPLMPYHDQLVLSGKWEYDIHVDSFSETAATVVDCQSTAAVKLTNKNDPSKFAQFADHREVHAQYTFRDGKWVMTANEYKNVASPGGMKYCPNLPVEQHTQRQLRKYY